MHFLLSLLGGVLSWAAGNSFLLALLILVLLLYTGLGKAMWTLMFLTDPDSACELRRAAMTPQGVPLVLYAAFLLLWPVMLLGPILQGRLLFGRHLTTASFPSPSTFPASPAASPAVSSPSRFAAARVPMRT